MPRGFAEEGSRERVFLEKSGVLEPKQGRIQEVAQTEVQWAINFGTLEQS